MSSSSDAAKASASFLDAKLRRRRSLSAYHVTRQRMPLPNSVVRMASGTLDLIGSRTDARALLAAADADFLNHLSSILTLMAGNMTRPKDKTCPVLQYRWLARDA